MSVHHLAVDGVVDAPVADVWAVVDDTSRYAEWVDGVLAVRRHHGRATVGATYEEHNRSLGPLTTESTWTVERVEPERLRVDTGTGFAPLRDLTNIFTFVPSADGRTTTVTYAVSFRLPLGPLGPLVGRLLCASLRGEFETSLRQLDELVRSERAPS